MIIMRLSVINSLRSEARRTRRTRTGVSAGGDSPLGEPVQPGGRPGRGARVSTARGGAGTQEALRGRQRGGVEWVEGFARGLLR